MRFKYENAITSDKVLVIANGTPEEVAQARRSSVTRLSLSGSPLDFLHEARRD